MVERAIDTFIHSELLFLKLPVLFLNPGVKRRTEWADAREPAEIRASAIPSSGLISPPSTRARAS